MAKVIEYMEEELNGKKYEKIEELGRGGVGQVWKVRDTSTNEILAYKIYNFKKSKAHIAASILKNVDALVKIYNTTGYLMDVNNEPIKYVVLPKCVIKKGHDNLHFRAVMDLVDTKKYIEFGKLNVVMGADVLCRIVLDMSRVFESLHLKYGWSYKDINEGNVYINPKTGEIVIIDFDNIGPSTNVTIKGTCMYMAPEVVMGGSPDSHTDKFSFAVFIYKLLIAGYPFIGKKTIDYCIRTETTYDDADTRKACFGTGAVFAWNPNDRSNSIEKINDNAINAQVELWNSLPSSVREAFEKTFVSFLFGDERINRTSAADWNRIFDRLAGELIICPNCGRKTFKNDKCALCATEISGSGAVKPVPGPERQEKNIPVVGQNVYCVLRENDKASDRIYKVRKRYRGEDLSSLMPLGDCFLIICDEIKKRIGIKNISDHTWEAAFPGETSVYVKPGQTLEVEKGLRIELVTRTVMLVIKDIR